jgi:hypothetical protein
MRQFGRAVLRRDVVGDSLDLEFDITHGIKCQMWNLNMRYIRHTGNWILDPTLILSAVISITQALERPATRRLLRMPAVRTTAEQLSNLTCCTVGQMDAFPKVLVLSLRLRFTHMPLCPAGK